MASESIRLAMALIWSIAALSKARRLSEFAQTVQEHIAVGRRASLPIASAILGTEVVIALGHSGAFGIREAAIGGLVLLTTFAGAATRVVIVGRTIECNCFGATGDRITSWSLVRIGLLVACETFLLFLPPTRQSPFTATVLIMELAVAAQLCCAVLWITHVPAAVDQVRQLYRSYSER